MKIRGYRQRQIGGGCLVTVVDDTGDERVLGLPRINPSREFRHSPDGYQWGYAGSGPTELARAILLAVIPGDDRVRHPMCYKRFKAAFIQGIKKDEFELDSKAVLEWYEQWVSEHGSQVELGWLA